MINEVGALNILISNDSTQPNTNWGWIMEKYRFYLSLVLFSECMVDKFNEKKYKSTVLNKSPTDILTQKW